MYILYLLPTTKLEVADLYKLISMDIVYTVDIIGSVLGQIRLCISNVVNRRIHVELE